MVIMFKIKVDILEQCE